MNPITEKVIQRLSYERLLIAPWTKTSRCRITLDEVLQAAKEEPRIYEILPAILIYNPRIIRAGQKALRRHKNIQKFIENLFQNPREKKEFFGVDKWSCYQKALAYRDFLSEKRVKQKSLTMNLRLSEADKHSLETLTQKLGLKSLSETIRYLVSEKMKRLNPPASGTL